MSLVLQLQHLWSGSGGSVDLPVLLDSGSVMTDVHELLAALQLDQQYRWQTTAPWLAEDYLNHLTRLPAGIDWRLELVVGEFQSRPETQPLTQDQLQKRFPDLKELWQHLVRIPRQTELTEAVELVTTRLESLYGHEGTTPQLEYSLANLPVAFRSEALTRLLTVELSHLQNRGMTIIPATWTRRFPRYQSELSSIFGTPPEQPGSPDPAQTIIDPQRTLPVTHGPSGQPALLGDYELLSELGRGGMGVVYRARQRGLNRTVALKTVLAQSGGSDEDIRRFRNEAEAAAQLRHPGIVAVFDVGETDGRHYYSMEYIEGDDLSRLIRENTLPGEQAAKFVRQLAEAVQYAHDHGVLHRDLKPSNVLLDRQGTLKITDFGLARRIKADSQMTREFSVMGTPSYMPPEQAMPTRGPVGPWSDIYSLGAVLYELLTARPPFRADNPLETMRQVINDEPIAPQLLNSKIAMDLQTICLKCLEKEPSRRYDSARTLAEELSRYLEGKPILARPLGRAERFWRLCRRHPRESILAGVILSTILTAVIGITSQWRRAEANLKTAERNFDLLSRAADDMLGVVEEWVTRAPPAAGPQQEKLNSSLLLFEAFLDEEPANRKAQQRLAETHLRVAEIHRLLRHFDDAVQHQQ
ncbi:MAG: serine/threonine-protein kinase, partial [Planctomycetota bacterium]